MAKDLTPASNTWHASLRVPSPGEPRNVANSLELPLQQALDNLQWLYDKLSILSTSGLADRSVTTAKLVDGAVTLAKLAPEARPWEVAWFEPGKPAANAIALKYVCARRIQLLKTFVGAAHADVAPAAAYALVLRRNGNQIGTVSWQGGQNIGGIVLAADVTLTAGDVLTLGTPGSADAALAGVAVTLAGVLT